MTSRTGDWTTKSTGDRNSKKNPVACHGVLRLNLAMTYFRMVEPTLSSALSGFTSEFEMDSGGSRTLLSPGNSVEPHHSAINAPLAGISDKLTSDFVANA